MLDTVLRVYSEQFDVNLFVNHYQNLVISDVFKKGEPDMFGNPNTYSGFDVIVAENESSEACIERIQQFLDIHQQAFSFLKANNVTCVLDLDVTVTTSDEMPTPLNLPAELLGTLNKLNIAIEFTAYPQH